jgi:hypothetical protein
MTSAFMRLWGWPIALGLLTAFGLIAALVGDGTYDAASWIGLGVPLAVAARHIWGR